MREALGAILGYVIVTLGALVILQSAGIDLTSLNVLVGAVGVVGEVRAIGARATTIVTDESVASIVPNSPMAEVESVEAGLAALRFQLQVWSTDLNFEVWRQLAAAGEHPVLSTEGAALVLGLPLGPSRHTRDQ